MISKAEIIATNIDSRKDEVDQYSFNVENYERALARIDSDHPGDGEIAVMMREQHKPRLEKLLKDEKFQRAIAQLALDVMKEQI